MGSKIYIPGRMQNAAVDEEGNRLPIAGASDILDDELNKPQSQINKEVDNALEDIYRKEEVYTKEETYNKTEVNNLITTPNQKYVTVTATDQTSSVTDVLPATGEKDTVYRVGNWDGTQYDTTVYTEYGWNGTAYISLNTKEYGIDDELIAGSDNLAKSGTVFSALRYNVIKDEHVIAGDSQQIVSLGFISSGEKIHLKVSNESGSSITHFYLLYDTSDMHVVKQWSTAFDEVVTINTQSTYALYTNIASGGNLAYDVLVEIFGEFVYNIYEKEADDNKNITKLSADTSIVKTTTSVEQTTPTQNVVNIGKLYAGMLLSIQCKNISGKPSGTWMFYFNGTTWTNSEEHLFEISADGNYNFYTNIAESATVSSFTYDVVIKVIGEARKDEYLLEKDVNSLEVEVEENSKVGVYKIGEDTDSVINTSKTINLGLCKQGTVVKIDLSKAEQKNVTDWSSFGWNIQLYDVTHGSPLYIFYNSGSAEIAINSDAALAIKINTANCTLDYELSYEISSGYLKSLSDKVHDVSLITGVTNKEKYGHYDSSAQISELYKFNTFKTSRYAATTQQINHIGVLPAGTKVRLVISDFVVNSGNGFCLHYISYNDGQGWVNLAQMTYSGTIEVTLDGEHDISTISNIGPNTAISYDLTCQYGTSLPASSIDAYIATWKDGVVSKDSVIKAIHINVPTAGKYTFGVGTVDWRPIAIVSKTFELDLVAGEQTVVLNENVLVRSGEKVFVFYNKNGSDGLCCVDYTSETSDEKFLYGKASDLLSVYNSTGYGGGLLFDVIYTPIDSIFGFKEDVEELKESVNSNASDIQDLSSSVNVIKDASGNNYELMVVDGVVTPIIMQYSKALIMGNSLSLGMDYYNNPYGMLATKPNLDYVSHILSALQSKVPASTVYKSVSSYYLEHNLLETDFDTMFASIDTWDFDLIIYQGGENVQQNGYASYQQALTNLMTYLKSKCPTAKFVITGVVLADIPVLESAARNVAKNIGAKYVYCNGHTPDVVIGVSNIWWNKVNEQYQPSTYIQQTHPNDLGFLNLANLILASIGYNTINKLHSIEVEAASINYNAPKVGVESGIVTIKTYGESAPTITVTDGNGNNIVVTHFNLSDFDYDNRFADGSVDPATYSSIFEMPNTDVVITIE